jgi:hypothetical protein
LRYKIIFPKIPIINVLKNPLDNNSKRITNTKRCKIPCLIELDMRSGAAERPVGLKSMDRDGGKGKNYHFTGLDRPSELQEVKAPRISGLSAHEGGKVVSHTHWLPLPPKNIPGIHFC